MYKFPFYVSEDVADFTSSLSHAEQPWHVYHVSSGDLASDAGEGMQMYEGK